MCIIDQFEQELRLRFSEQTVRSYTKQFRNFLEYFKGKDIRYLSLDDLKAYTVSLQEFYGYSAIVHAVSAIKFYYANLNSRKREIDIALPRKPKTIPQVLSSEEVKQMIEANENIKHRAIIETIFYHGLRSSELINLKISNIDSKNEKLWVINSKGRKDREIPLSEECLKTLRIYYKKYHPSEFLFEGEKGNKYTKSSLYKVVVNTAKKAGIKRKVHPHTLRHSFASYLVNHDISHKKIQEWLGHKSLKTTEIYCHLEKHKNPICL